MKSKNLLSSKITLFLLLVFAAFLGNLKFQQIKQNKQIEAEKEKIVAQIEAISKKNQDISSSLQYFKSQGFKQRVAREQMNLKKNGEQVYSFKQENFSSESQNAETAKEQISNPNKWLNYFSGLAY